MRTSTRSLARYCARPSAPPNPPIRTGADCAAGAVVRPASETVTFSSTRSTRRSAKRRASVVPPRMRMRRMTLTDSHACEIAAARLGWSLPETMKLSLHGRSLDLIRPHLQPGARVVVLTSDSAGPAALSRLLAGSGFGSSRMTVLEALGGPRERVRATTAARFDLDEVGPLNAVAIEVEASPGARVLARAPGLPDALFEHDGQITKR